VRTALIAFLTVGAQVPAFASPWFFRRGQFTEVLLCWILWTMLMILVRLS